MRGGHVGNPTFPSMIPSFNTQLEECLHDLWRYAWSLTRNHENADDLVQDCIERALRKRRLWIPGRPLKPWLTRIMLNLYRDRWRSDTRRTAVAMDHAGQIADFSAGPEDRVEIREVCEALEKVPQDQRQALLAVVVAGLSYDEAASALGIPKGTLMSRISRARAKLKDEMDQPTVPKIRSVK